MNTITFEKKVCNKLWNRFLCTLRYKKLFTVKWNNADCFVLKLHFGWRCSPIFTSVTILVGSTILRECSMKVLVRQVIHKSQCVWLPLSKRCSILWCTIVNMTFLAELWVCFKEKYILNALTYNTQRLHCSDLVTP